jgi:hypothetical protein
MATYLPEIQDAGERQWRHRTEVLYPALAREAALLRERDLARPRGGAGVLDRWVRLVRAAVARPAGASRAAGAPRLDGAA